MSVATEEMLNKTVQKKRDMQVKQDEASARRDMTAKRIREQTQEAQTKRANEKIWQGNKAAAEKLHSQKTQQIAQHHQQTQTAIERHRISQMALQQRARPLAPANQFKHGQIKAITPITVQPKIEPKKEVKQDQNSQHSKESPAVRMARAIERVERGPQLKPVPEKPKEMDNTRERGYSR